MGSEHRLHRSADRYEEAIADYGEVIILSDDPADGYRERGVTHAMNRYLDAALSDLDAAIASDPLHILAHPRPAASCMPQRGDYAAAVADYSDAIRLDPRTRDTASWAPGPRS